MDLASNAQLVAFLSRMNIIICMSLVKLVVLMDYFLSGMSTIICMSLVKPIVMMDFDWPLVIGNTFIPFFSPSTPFVVELNVPLHQSMDLASNATKLG